MIKATTQISQTIPGEKEAQCGAGVTAMIKRAPNPRTRTSRASERNPIYQGSVWTTFSFVCLFVCCLFAEKLLQRQQMI